MLRALVLSLILLAGPAVASEPQPAPLVCSPALAQTLGSLCGTVQLAASGSCPQTCYDDQNICHAGCDKVYRGGGQDHDKCMAACSTTYGRCQTRCNAPQR